MKKDKAKFVLAEASIDEVNKQLRINLLVMAVVIAILAMNVMQFLKHKTIFYAFLSVLMLLLLFFIAQARNILKSRKQQLTE
ncbi:hypothetical protein M0N77_01340 [Psychrobacter sp. AH5]|uniref:hypothetical protein n=1 Tax=Psychrobacter sp. AH5 TaxID=2937433 RepID=UPI00333FBCB8